MTPATVRNRVPLPIVMDDGVVAEAHVVSFSGLLDGQEHVALELGEPEGGVPLVRMHSECLTGDVLGSQRCDCGPQLREAITRIRTAGGYLLYLRQEGRGIGLYNKIDAYALQDDGLDTYEANVALGFGPDERDYVVAAQMLAAVGVDQLDLFTNNPHKVERLLECGLRVRRRVPTGLHLSAVNAGYLATKAGGGHGLLGLVH